MKRILLFSFKNLKLFLGIQNTTKQFTFKVMAEQNGIQANCIFDFLFLARHKCSLLYYSLTVIVTASRDPHSRCLHHLYVKILVYIVNEIVHIYYKRPERKQKAKKNSRKRAHLHGFPQLPPAPDTGTGTASLLHV